MDKSNYKDNLLNNLLILHGLVIAPITLSLLFLAGGGEPDVVAFMP